MTPEEQADIECPSYCTLPRKSVCMYREFRSRPAPAPEAMITEFNKRMGSGQTINQNDPDCGVQFTVQQLKEHDTAIATQAREQVLDELSEFNSNEYLRRNGRCGFFEVFTNWKTKMESLREAQR